MTPAHPMSSPASGRAARLDLRKAAPWLVLLLLLLAWVIRTDVAHAGRVAGLSAEGSAPPARDASSPTGYTLGQRHFLGTHERGETWRWIASTQHALDAGLFAPAPAADNVPLGRSHLEPRLYTAWLVLCTRIVALATGEHLPIAAELTAHWEPVAAHVAAFCLAVLLGWRRSGPHGAAVLGLVFALFPPVLAQFLPGVLTPRTWALLLAAAALLPTIDRTTAAPRTPAIRASGALLAALALCLAPAIGFPVVLVAALSGGVAVALRRERLPFLSWACIGALVTLAGWLIDRAPLELAAGELRYVHPLYALAWLGLGLALDGWQRLRAGHARGAAPTAALTAGATLCGIFVFVQVTRDLPGWLHPTAALRRIASLDETRVFASALQWLGQAPLAETLLVLLPIAVALATLVAAVRRRPEVDAGARRALLVAMLPLLGAVALGLFQVRLLIVAVLIAVPLTAALAAHAGAAMRRVLLVGTVAFFIAGAAGEGSLPHGLRRSTDAAAPGPDDIQTLIHRHIARWMVTHNPPGSVAALAPPELSDSLVFHGGCRVLMSTAWESYPGHVAASRILSSPEATEAEAVIESRGVSHLILPSWDRVLPLLVKAPLEEDRTTLFARLDVWRLPPYLRPIPYHLPPAPGYETQRLAVFKVTPPQDEALLLSRLAEYFVEMNRGEPAALAARVLAEAYGDDPNARLARASVAAHHKDAAAFERELEPLAVAAAAGQAPFDWDRRVQRAVILAMARRADLARTEIEACLATATPELVFDLTPLQAHRLAGLARRYSLAIPDPGVAAALASLSAEYTSPADPAPR